MTVVHGVRAIGLAAMLMVPCAARADTLTKAQNAFDALEFDRAETFFRQAIERPGSREERIKAWRGLALSQCFRGRGRDAERSFETLLLLEPSATVDASLGPKVVKPFESAKQTLGAKRNRLLVGREKSGQVIARMEQDVPLASDVWVFTRREGAEGFDVVTRRANQVLSIQSPSPEPVEVFAEAYDATEGVVYVFASEAQPARLVPDTPLSDGVDGLRIVSEPAPSRRELWPLFVGIGTGAAIAVTASLIFLAPPKLKIAPADQQGQLE